MMFLVVRVACGARTLENRAKLFTKTTTLKEVVDWAVKGIEGLGALLQLEVFATKAEALHTGTTIGIEEFSTVTVADISAIGQFLVLRTASLVMDAPPTPHVSASEVTSRLMASQRPRLSLPTLVSPLEDGPLRFDGQLFNAVVATLPQGFPGDHAEGSGRRMVMAVRDCLQKILPRLDAFTDRGAHIPEPFLALASHVKRSTKHHTTAKDKRLNHQRILDLASQLSTHIEATLWSRSKAWQPYMAHLRALVQAMEKVSVRKVEQSSTQVQAFQSRTEQHRSPSQPDHVICFLVTFERG